MYSKITTAGICGVDSFLAYVEVDVSKGMPYLEMVGLLSSEVREARERVRVALKNSNIEIKPLKITVNISPASIRKEGAAYDLPIAIGILVSLGFLSQEMIKDTLIIGELGLDGRIKGVNGVLPIINNGKQHGIKTVILPFDNIAEATLVEDIEYIAMEYLEELISYLTSNKERRNFIQREKKKIIQTMMLEKERERESVKEEKEDLSDVLGQECLKRAALIAAAGFHNLLIIGPPGSGKTMIAKRIPSILPSLTKEEQIEITSVYSVAGLLKEGEFIMKERPYKNPHHSITCQALSGGGRNPKPGILSLCHKGVLFLDEFPEYKRETIECLRQPLEEKSIQITRCNGAYTYPADIMLVAAMNACPCGYYPDLTKCNCSEQEIRKYRSRISGPILDRLDMCVTAQKMQ
ncbi:MAG: YifB family Mg chelatase-like AAA ATPase, partial [Lachnospiraceae bacterium]